MQVYRRVHVFSVFCLFADNDRYCLRYTVFAFCGANFDATWRCLCCNQSTYAKKIKNKQNEITFIIKWKI